MTDHALTPAQEKRIAAAADKFRRDMEKTGLGVRIKAGDGPWVTVTDPPKEAKKS
jgi:hypothetical protein